ncbi:MAG: right-handed parallel beta-helix repeat-containing protein, partial [Candidatus Thorarchaeota archaeon]
NLNNANNITISNNELFSSYLDEGALNIVQSNDIKITGNYFHNNSKAIHIRNSDNLIMMLNNFANNNHGIYSLMANNVTIASNNLSQTEDNYRGHGMEILGKYWDGKRTHYGGSNVLVRDNFVSGKSTGVRVYDYPNLSIIHNVIHENSFGIEVQNSSVLHIRNNTLYNNELWAIKLRDSLNVAIQWNDVIGNRLDVFYDEWIDIADLTAQDVRDNISQIHEYHELGTKNTIESNYWGRETVVDLDNDQVVDFPIKIGGNVYNEDSSPLTAPKQHLTAGNLHFITPPRLLFPIGFESLSGLVNVTWEPSQDYPYDHSISYNVFYGICNQSINDSEKCIQWNSVGTGKLVASNFMWDSNLVPNGWYHIKIVATDSAGISAFDTNDRIFSIGLNRKKNELRLENPSSGFLISVNLLFGMLLISVWRKRRN